MYHIIELESQAEILFAHTYETRHYDLSFAPQEDYIEISYIERGEAVVYNRLRGRGRTCFHGPTDCQAE